MMLCLRCQHENPAGAKFCNGCGSKLELACARCAHANLPDSRFCAECGSALAGAAPASTARFESPQAYTPRHLAEKILVSRSVLEGERKQVTVLFADIKGSMELIAERDPEEARRILDPVLDLMMEAVHRFEGTVNQVMGDGIMALFGAPLAHEEHAVRACFAALAMQTSIRRFSEDLRRSHGAEVQVRIGLNSGEVVVRGISNDLHMEYTAVGQTVHLAARMEQLAPAGSVRLTIHTLSLAEGFIQVDPLGPVPVKGSAAPLEVFDLLGASVLRTRVQAAAARGLTQFVGRRNEMDAIVQAIERCRNGRGEVLALVGEPGVGKSRLVWEFTHSHRTRDWLVLESGSVSYGKATAYRPLIDLLKAYFRIEERDDQRRVREKITGKLLTLDKSLESTLQAFMWLLDMGVDDPEWHRLHPPQRRTRTLEACKRLMLRESQVQPLLLVFEDLHWIDSETHAFLDGLVESLPVSRLFLLVNYRPEFRHSWGNKTCYAQIHVDPLPAESSEELLAGLVGADPALAPLRRMLIERTEGNPFFLEESVRSLVESGVLVGERGSYRATASPAEIEVPARIQPLLAARIDRLPADYKRLLQNAAVVGKDVPYSLLVAIADMPEDALREALVHLQTAEFLYETSLFPDLEYTFKHSLTHDVAYNGMLQERRRAIHARIVDAIETVYAVRLAEHADRLGQHAFRGEQWEKAVRYLQQAGARSISRSTNAEAAGYYEQALESLRHLPDNADATQRIIDIHLAMRNALHPLGEFDRVLQALNHARALAEKLGDESRLGRVLAFMSQSYRVKADYGRALETGGQAVRIGEKFGDIGIRATSQFHVGQICFLTGAHRDAIASHRRNLDMLDGDLALERHGMAGLPSVFSRGHMAWSLAELGDFNQAIAVCEEASHLAREAKHPFTQAFAEYAAGYVLLRQGRMESATRRLETGFEMCQSMNIRLELPYVGTFLGLAYVLNGNAVAGFDLIERAVQSADRIKLAAASAWLACVHGEALLECGDSARAAQALAQALELSKRHGERGWEAWSLYLSAELSLKAGDHAAARQALDHALRITTELGLRPLAARCGLAFAQCCLADGDARESTLRAEAARTQLRAMDMQFWLDRPLAGQRSPA